MLAVSSQTFEDSCRIAQRNSLESATLSLNLFQGFILSFFFFLGEKDVKSEAPPFLPTIATTTPFSLLSSFYMQLDSHTCFLFDTKLITLLSTAILQKQKNKTRIERIGKGQVTMQILVSRSENLKEGLDIF